MFVTISIPNKDALHRSIPAVEFVLVRAKFSEPKIYLHLLIVTLSSKVDCANVEGEIQEEKFVYFICFHVVFQDDISSTVSSKNIGMVMCYVLCYLIYSIQV